MARIGIVTQVQVRATVDGMWRFELADVTLAADLMDCRQIVVRSDVMGEAANIIKEGLSDERMHFVNFEITIDRREEVIPSATK